MESAGATFRLLLLVPVVLRGPAGAAVSGGTQDGVSRPSGSELGALFAMESAGATFRLLLLVPVVLRGPAGAAVSGGTQDGAPSLSCVFSVFASGPPWSEFLGMINGTEIFKYSCETKMATPVGPLGRMQNATGIWNERCEHWKDLVEELRKALLLNKENISKAFHSVSLRVRMTCQQESTGCHNAFCQFDINGQMCLLVDLKNRHWTEGHPGCRSLKETLESENYGIHLCAWVSDGDCRKLLIESTVLDTKAASAPARGAATPPADSATPATATTTVSAPATVPASSKAMDYIPGILLILCFLILLGFFLGWIYKKRGCCFKAPASGSCSTRIRFGWRPFHHPEVRTCDLELQPL